MSRRTLAVLTVALLLGSYPTLAHGAYRPKVPAVTTPWTAKVSRTAPLPEYPRPQMRRSEWKSLNGQWEFAVAKEGEAPPFGRTLAETILVPYPMQSALSGIARQEKRTWYRRTFEVPAGWRSRRVILHFGAVTNQATVYVNGKLVGSHRGSYDAFSLDVTDALRASGPNELVVGVVDPLAYGGGQPVGKQNVVEVSVVHTASSGIWQTVWLEPVGSAHLTRLDQTPDLRGERLLVTPRVADGEGTTVVLRARAAGKVIGSASGPAGRRIALPVPSPKLWSPERPFLYDLEVELRRGGRVLDRVRSYFGMRSIGLKRIDGVTRIVLNGKFVFQIGPLDQGFWPDGIYTAPTDAGLRFDIAETKRLGFNMTRKHVKVEPQRWYYWADRLGLLVWQDMPNMSIYRRVQASDKARFERELRAMVVQHRSSPAIVAWTPFNEGWGEYDVTRITREVKRWDPSRLVNGDSGSANCCLADESNGGDVRDGHIYAGPLAPEPDSRASVIGEFAGCDDRTPAGEVGPPVPGFGTAGERANRGVMRQGWAALRQQMRSPGLSGAIYTQLTNIEHEVGLGLLSSDRRHLKCAAKVLPKLNRELIAASRRPASLRPQPAAIPAGTRALWTFAEGDGSTVHDRSGNDHDLRLAGGATRARGYRGAGLRVRGGGQRAVARGAVVDTAGSYTVSAWLQYAAPARSASALSQGNGFSLGLRVADDRPDLDPAYPIEAAPGPFPQPKWNFAVASAATCVVAACAVRANPGYGDSRIDPRAGRWYHVTGVVDRATRTAGLYVDGVPLDLRIARQRVAALARFALGTGKLGSDGSTESFDGRIDQVRVYARALSAAEVWRLYRAAG